MRGVVFAQHAHHLLGLGALGERGEAAQVAEHDGDLAAMARSGSRCRPDDRFGSCGEKKRLNRPTRSSSSTCSRHALLERHVPFADLGGQPLRAVVQRLDPQHRAHAGDQRAVVDRLGEVLVGAASRPAITSLLSVIAVSRMIGVKGIVASARRRLQTSMPSRRGIITSSRIRSGPSSRTATSAASPSAAVTMS